MPSAQKIIGLLQLGLAILAMIAASGVIDFDPEALAAIIAVQNALTGGARLRRPEASDPPHENGSTPIN